MRVRVPAVRLHVVHQPVAVDVGVQAALRQVQLAQRAAREQMHLCGGRSHVRGGLRRHIDGAIDASGLCVRHMDASGLCV
jgi:hypothetical protein